MRAGRKVLSIAAEISGTSGPILLEIRRGAVYVRAVSARRFSGQRGPNIKAGLRRRRNVAAVIKRATRG